MSFKSSKSNQTHPVLAARVVELHERHGLPFDIIGLRIGRSTNASWLIYDAEKKRTKKVKEGRNNG